MPERVARRVGAIEREHPQATVRATDVEATLADGRLPGCARFEERPPSDERPGPRGRALPPAREREREYISARDRVNGATRDHDTRRRAAGLADPHWVTPGAAR